MLAKIFGGETVTCQTCANYEKGICAITKRYANPEGNADNCDNYHDSREIDT